MILITICKLGTAYFILGRREVPVEGYISLVKEAGVLKKAPDETSQTLHTLPVGTPLIVVAHVTYLHQSYEKIGAYVNGQRLTGYVLKDKLKKYEFDESFEAKIQKFPESYRQSLRYIHSLYSHWHFRIMYSNHSFEDAAKAYQKKALIASDKNSLIESTKIIEGKVWRKANIDTVRYYLDPRNHLSASQSVMFEQQTLNKEETLNDARKMLADTFMTGMEPTSNKKWETLYYQAALKYNISLSNLIARAIVEQAAKETKSGGAGNIGGHARGDKSGKIYYNIFNIGANSGAQDGIDYAKKQGWDTREKAINGGADYLSRKYIQSGQDTLYLQRFDIHYKNLGTHSYMTNIMAPVNEAKHMFDGYMNIKNENITRRLLIPVYLNMPKNTDYPDRSDLLNRMSFYKYYFFKDISQMKFKYQKNIKYTGNPVTPQLKVYSGVNLLRENIDYTIHYSSHTKKGKVNVTVFGLNQYYNTYKFTYNIN